MDESNKLHVDEKAREKWSRKAEYFLSMVGYLVGLGNLWRFPYICMRNGGGAFLIPYIFFLVFCGMPLFFLETAVGQFSGKGFLHVWEVCPLFKGIGVGMLVPLMVINVYYNMIIGWTLYYIGHSFVSPLPWTTCSSEWNSPNCAEDRGIVGYLFKNVSVKSKNETFYDELKYHGRSTGNETSKAIINTTSILITPQEDFWQQKVLQMSSGIETLGNLNWQMLLCLLGAWIIVGLCIIKGVKSVGKIVFVTATLPYILLTIILIRGLTLDGSIDGVILYLRPDFSKLLKIQVWIEAALQVFYSLGPGWGPLISMSSFNKFDNNCLRDSVLLSVLGEGTSIYSGLVIFTVLGFMSTKLDLPLDKIVKSGPGLGFIAYPEALSQLPGQNFWCCLFFIMLLTVGLDSQFAVTEAVIGVFVDSFQGLRRRRVLLTIVACIISFLCGIIFCTQGGIYSFQLVDWYVAAFSLPIFGFLECIIFAWIYGMERLSQDVYLMLGRGIPVFYRLCLGFITPIILLGLIIASFIGYKPPTYGSYQYPDYAVAIGVFLSVLPILPILVFALLAIKTSKGETLVARLKNAVRPTMKWTPISTEYKEGYSYEDEEIKHSFVEKLKINFTGKTF